MTPGHKNDQTGHETGQTGQNVSGTPGHASRAHALPLGVMSRLSPGLNTGTQHRDTGTHRRDTSPLRSELSPGHSTSQNLTSQVGDGLSTVDGDLDTLAPSLRARISAELTLALDCLLAGITLGAAAASAWLLIVGGGL